jgi:hypothetical protein
MLSPGKDSAGGVAQGPLPAEPSSFHTPLALVRPVRHSKYCYVILTWTTYDCPRYGSNSLVSSAELENVPRYAPGVVVAGGKERKLRQLPNAAPCLNVTFPFHRQPHKPRRYPPQPKVK